MGDTYDQDKRLIRDRLRASRSRLSSGEVARLSARACARLLASPVFARARHIAAYAAADNELDPALLVEAALAAGKNVYLPVTSRERFDFVGVPVARPGHRLVRSGARAASSQHPGRARLRIPGGVASARGPVGRAHARHRHRSGLDRRGARAMKENRP